MCFDLLVLLYVPRSSTNGQEPKILRSPTKTRKRLSSFGSTARTVVGHVRRNRTASPRPQQRHAWAGCRPHTASAATASRGITCLARLPTHGQHSLRPVNRFPSCYFTWSTFDHGPRYRAASTLPFPAAVLLSISTPHSAALFTPLKEQWSTKTFFPRPPSGPSRSQLLTSPREENPTRFWLPCAVTGECDRISKNRRFQKREKGTKGRRRVGDRRRGTEHLGGKGEFCSLSLSLSRSILVWVIVF
jgi:hypothetical protein